MQDFSQAMVSQLCINCWSMTGNSLPNWEPEPREYAEINDLVAAMFCGELVTDASMAASWGGLDIRTHQWDEQVLDALRIPRKALPSVLPSSHPYGSVRPEFASKHGLGYRDFNMLGNRGPPGRSSGVQAHICWHVAS